MSTTELKKTAFDAAQRELTSEWTDWEGWAWAADFGDAIAEHRATREASNLWDESALRKWDIRGADAIALADVAFTNDMAALEVGQVRYGALCDESGMMVMDGTIFKLADDHCFSITSYDSDLAWLRKVASDRGLDVTIEDITAATPHLQVQGPQIARDPRADHRGHRPRAAPLLPLRARGGHDRRDPVHGLADGVLGRTGLRALLQRRRRHRALECGARGRQAAGHAADRPVGDRDAAHRVGPAVPRHRLLPGQDRPVRGAPRQRREARQARRLRRQGGAAAHRRRRARRGC